MGKTREKRQDKTQIGSLLAVATVLLAYGLSGSIHEIKLPMQELELNMQGGIIAGFYGI